MSEMASVFSPMAHDMAPILAAVDGPERAGKVTPQDINALIGMLHSTLEGVFTTDTPDYVRSAFETLLATLHRYALEESVRRGELMLDNLAEASRSSQSSQGSQGASKG